MRVQKELCFKEFHVNTACYVYLHSRTNRVDVQMLFVHCQLQSFNYILMLIFTSALFDPVCSEAAHSVSILEEESVARRSW
jgi:hypothetical protein